MVFSPKQEDIMLELKDEKLDKSTGLQRKGLEGCIINRKSASCLSRNQNLMLGIYFALFAAFTWSRFFQYQNKKEIKKVGGLIYLSASLCNFVY